MSFFRDMSTTTMVDAGDHVRAVGWLCREEPFTRGVVSPEFVERLREFARRWGESTEALGWGVFMGVHTCEFCHACVGFGNFGVPRDAKLFVAPDLIVHYVEAHQYAPPIEFIDAVVHSP